MSKEKLLKNVYLIDGSSVLTSIYKATIPYDWNKGNKSGVMKTSKGIYTNGVFGMTKFLLNLIKNFSDGYIAVMWDVNRNTFRRKIYEEYKGNRSKTDEELVIQFELMKEVIDCLGIKQFELEGFEADDLIGSVANSLETNNTDICINILSYDRDLLQLLTENVRVWLHTAEAKYSDFISELINLDYLKGTGIINEKEIYNTLNNYIEYTHMTFEDEYGIKPKRFADYKGFVGDKSDNIPGVAQVGEKTALPLLKEFGNLDGVYEYFENNSDKEIKVMCKELGIRGVPTDKLINGKEVAYMSRDLAKIDILVPEMKNINKKDLLYKIESKRIMEKFKQLEFNSLIVNN